MDISAVMTELSTAAAAIPGLRVVPFTAARVNPPELSVGWPDPYEYDTTMGRGADQLRFPLTVCAGSVDARSSLALLGKYAAGAGTHSVKRFIELYPYTSCHFAVVKAVEFGVITAAGVEYLSAMFSVQVVGSGT